MRTANIVTSESDVAKNEHLNDMTSPSVVYGVVYNALPKKLNVLVTGRECRNARAVVPMLIYYRTVKILL